MVGRGGQARTWSGEVWNAHGRWQVHVSHVSTAVAVQSRWIRMAGYVVLVGWFEFLAVV